jgi:hypothetical protein
MSPSCFRLETVAGISQRIRVPFRAVWDRRDGELLRDDRVYCTSLPRLTFLGQIYGPICR